MGEKIPIGIQVARAVNLIFIVLDIIIGVLMVAIAAPKFIMAAEKTGKHTNPALWIVVGLIFIIGVMPAVLLVMLNRNLRQLKASARAWQIVVSSITLLWFPSGTIVSLVVLYFVLFDKKTKEAFVL